MTAQRKKHRRQTVKDHKRTLILEAAREVFTLQGLEGASLRAIASRAGYTPAALYFHFESKEAIYAELLRLSLETLKRAVDAAVVLAGPCPGDRLHAAAMAFFTFYAEHPHDLDLGFYLLRGGMQPHGLGARRNRALNEGLAAALRPIGDAALALGTTATDAQLLVADTFAHAAGLLLLVHTGRIRMFGVSAQELMSRYVQDRVERLNNPVTPSR